MNVPAPDDPLALHAALDAAKDAMHAAESGDRTRAYQILTEATAHGANAYQEGHPGRVALAYILATITAEVAAPDADPEAVTVTPRAVTGSTRQ